jgi:macrolide-specific efflux system membrane fusion protein
MNASMERSKIKKMFFNKWIGLLLTSGLLLGGWSWWKNKKSNEVTYRETRLEKRDLAVRILTTGSVQPENRLEIKAPIAGRMEEVLVREGQKVSKGQILAWMSSSERAALLDAARSQGGAEFKKWQELYRPTPIVAPIHGTLILRSVEPGQTFTNIEPILVMSDRLTIKAQFDETDIAQIKLEQEANVLLDAYADKTIPAKIGKIAFEAKTVNNVTTYVVDVLPLETPDFMRSGMTANVSVLIESKPQVLSLGTEFLDRKEDGSFSVLKKTSTGAPEEALIKTGISDGKFIEIESGLLEGDTVLKAEVKSTTDKAGNTNPFSPFRSNNNNNRKRSSTSNGSAGSGTTRPGAK